MSPVIQNNSNSYKIKTNGKMFGFCVCIYIYIYIYIYIRVQIFGFFAFYFDISTVWVSFSGVVKWYLVIFVLAVVGPI